MGIGDLAPLIPPPDQSQPQQPFYVNPLTTAGLPSIGGAYNTPPPPQQDWSSQLSGVLQKSGATPTTQTPTAPQPRAINFVNGAGQGAAGQTSSSDRPLSFLPTAGEMHTIAAHDVQLGSSKAINTMETGATEAANAQDEMAQAQAGANEAKAGAETAAAGATAGMGEKAEKAHADTNAKIDKALALIDPNNPKNNIDPNHYMSQMSAGKRILLAVAAGMSGAGMALNHQGGKNPILEQIEQETARDIDAQKSKLGQKMSMYGQLKEQGLNDEQASAAVAKYYGLAAIKSADAQATAAQSPIYQAKADEAKAQIKTSILAPAEAKLYGRVQAQTVGTGQKTFTDAMAKEALQRSNDSKGAVSIDQAKRDVARAHGVPYTGGPGETQEWGTKQNPGVGRSAGVQMEYQQNLNRYDAFLSQLGQAEDMIKQGGQISPARTAQGHTLLNAMAAELGYVNAGKSPNETELKTAQEMLPSDLNAYNFTGTNAAKLAQVRQMIEEKRAALMKAGPNITAGAGFAPGQSAADAAAAAGATEK